MNKKRLTYISLIGVILLIASCAPAKKTSTEPAKTIPTEVPGQQVFLLDGLSTYSSDFQVKFSGAKDWSYQLKTRRTPQLRERSLHIEGVEGDKNPGDIRLVTDGATSWMTGKGTDNECITFPNQQGMDPTFITPTAMVSMPDLASAMSLVGEESIGGATVQHYRSTAGASSAWKEVTIDVWRVKSNKLLYQFNIEASGDDPYFSAGSGKLSASYKASGQVDGKIEKVSGCEISVPLPKSATMFVRLPGMASFVSEDGVEQIVGFYQTELPKQKWKEKEPAATKQGDTVLSYAKGKEQVEIHIEEYASGGVQVKLLFLK